jgi:hypothetical protein
VKPSKPHFFLSRSVSSALSAQPGLPLIELNEHIAVSLPASIAALNGGRYRSCSRRTDMSVVL